MKDGELMSNFYSKSRNTYNKKAGNYDSTFDGKFTKKYKELLLSNVKLKDNDSVLDVACGNGTFLKTLSMEKRINGYGIDISEQMVKNASLNSPKMEFHVAGFAKQQFPYSTQSYR